MSASSCGSTASSRPRTATSRGGRRLALAVLTIGQPSQAYGEETIAGVARRVLTRRPLPAGAGLQPVRFGLWAAGALGLVDQLATPPTRG